MQPASPLTLIFYETKQADNMKMYVVNVPRQLKNSRKEKKRITNLLILLEGLWPCIKAEVKFSLQESFYSRMLCL